MPTRSLHVAVIGAGAAGLVAARELRREGHTPVVFERAAGVGGNWIYDDALADQPLGGAAGVHSSLYASLRTNLPRECMGFLDFPFVAGSMGSYSEDPRRYPGHREVLRYLEAFARRFDLHGLVRLKTEVVSIRGEDASAGWKVSYSCKLPGSDSEQEVVEEEEFDAVVVCNGLSEPRLADVAGIEDWPGKQMHSHSYRVPDPFHGQVVIGAALFGATGNDGHPHVEPNRKFRSDYAPALACSRVANMAIERLEGDGSVVFQDGSRVKADAILHCTGYKYSFPFLADDAGVYVDDNRVGPLYQHVFPHHLAPRLSFTGLHMTALFFPVCQLQSNWVAGVLSGRIDLPSQKEMMEHVAAFYSEMEAGGCPKRYTHSLGACTYEYEDWVAEQCGQESIEGWRKEMFVAVLKNAKNYQGEWDDGQLICCHKHTEISPSISD